MSYKVCHASWDNEFTLCGKKIDCLLHDEYVINIDYTQFEVYFSKFLNQEKTCKACILEIKHEAKLRRDKTSNFDDEVTMPIL